MIEPIVDASTYPPAPEKKDWWSGKGFMFIAGVAAFFAIGSSSVLARAITVPIVALASALQGWVDGVDSRRRE